MRAREIAMIASHHRGRPSPIHSPQSSSGHSIPLFRTPSSSAANTPPISPRRSAVRSNSRPSSRAGSPSRVRFDPTQTEYTPFPHYSSSSSSTQSSRASSPIFFGGRPTTLASNVMEGAGMGPSRRRVNSNDADVLLAMIERGRIQLKAMSLQQKQRDLENEIEKRQLLSEVRGLRVEELTRRLEREKEHMRYYGRINNEPAFLGRPHTRY